MVSMAGDKWSGRIGGYGYGREYGWWALWALCSLVSVNRICQYSLPLFQCFFSLLVGEMVKICLVVLRLTDDDQRSSLMSAS